MTRSRSTHRTVSLFLAWLVLGAIWGPGVALGKDRFWSLGSPDNRLSIEVRLDEGGGLAYRVNLASDATTAKTPVAWSRLGLVLHHFDQTDKVLTTRVADFTTGMRFVSATRSDGVEQYTLTVGKRLENENRYNALSLRYTEPGGIPMRLDLRAFNDGVAFRYALPGESNLHYRLVKELTEYRLGLGGKHWGSAYEGADVWHPAYEAPQSNGVPTGTTVEPDPRAGEPIGWSLPALFQTSGTWVLLHEAGVTRANHGSHLAPEAPGGVYRIAPPLADSAMGLGPNHSASPLPWEQPWRIIAVDDRLATLVESNLVTDLAPPCRIADTSWIKPGVCGWSWASDHDSSRNMATLQKFIDFSAEMAWPYMLIDANWNTISDTAMEDLVAYANERRVGLLFWYNSGGPNNYVTEAPRNRMHERRVRRAEFAKLQRLGVKGVKVDFFHSDKQSMIAQYLGILEDAADFQLLVNFHGCTVPRGWNRTYPNLMTMEGVRGAEYYTFESEPAYNDIAKVQNTILPFTRNAIGSMDYTPVVFTRTLVPPKTTAAHELALAVVFESGLQHFSDSVESYQALPTAPRELLRTVPTVWHETRLVSGYPGDHAVFARRFEDRWYVGGISSSDSPRTLKLDLSCLGPECVATLLKDAGNASEVEAEQVHLKNTAQCEFEVQPYGGFTLIVSPASE